MAVPTSILVLGAGELGTAVLTSLANHPSLHPSTSITVFLRTSTISPPNPSKHQNLDALHAIGIDFLAGDIDNDSPTELAAKFSAFDTVVGCVGMAGPAGTHVKITKALLAAGVKRYVPWQFGVDDDIIGPESSQDPFIEQLDVRTLLRGQKKTSWVIVSTGIFMSFLFEEVFGVVSGDRSTVRALGRWENEVTVTDVADIGKVVAEIVLVLTGITDQVVYTAGETISYERLADVVEQVDGSKVKTDLWTVERLKNDLREDPENGIKKYRVIFAEANGVAWKKESTLNAEKNIELQSVRDWLSSHDITWED